MVHQLIRPLIGLAFIAMAGTARAGLVVVDPGDVGDAFGVSAGFETLIDPDGTLEVAWDEMKHVQLFAGSLYEIGIFGLEFNGESYEFFLTDENGDAIPDTLAIGFATPFAFIGGLYPITEDLIFHDISFTFFTIPLPIIEGQDAFIYINTLLGGSLPLIGEWGAQIPEPTTLALFATGLAGLGFFMARRRRVVR